MTNPQSADAALSAIGPLAPLLSDLRWGALAIDAKRQIVWSNQAFQRMFENATVDTGAPVQPLLLEIVPNPDHREALEHSLNACATQRRTEHLPLLLFQTSAGREIEVNVTCVSVNLGPRQEPFTALLLEEAGPAMMFRRMFESLFESSPDGVIVFDRDRRIVMLNRAFEEMTQWSREELTESAFLCSQLTACQTEHGVSMEGALCPMFEVLSGETDSPTRREMVFKRRDGSDLHVEAQYYPVRDNWNAVRYIMSIIRDQTRQKETEIELAESRQLASLGLLTAGIAHELKNPLGSILSASEIIANPDRSDLQKQQAARYIKEEVKRMDRVIREFLAFARPAAPNLLETDLNQFLRECLLESADGRERLAAVNVSCKFDDALPKVWIDREQLRQVLLNLCLNALDAIPEHGGAITIATSRWRGDAILKFADNGAGIAEEDRERVFDPFFTRKSDGAGLGLSIVNKIVLAHHGRITVDSPDGNGATFTIRFPVRPPGMPAERTPEEIPIDFNGATGATSPTTDPEK